MLACSLTGVKSLLWWRRMDINSDESRICCWSPTLLIFSRLNFCAGSTASFSDGLFLIGGSELWETILLNLFSVGLLD